MTGDMELILAAKADFPETFGLRAFRGVFRISEDASYVTGRAVMLYTQRLVDGEWRDFAKGSPAELRAQIVCLK